MATGRLRKELSILSNRDKTRRVFQEIGQLSKAEILARYGTLAWGYINRSEMQAVESLLGRLEKTRPLEPMLDAGCGTGRLLLPLSRRYKITGLDFSQSFLDQIRSTHPDIPLALAPATQLPFAQGSFRAVLAVRLIQHLTADEQALFLEECRRVLAKGGVLVVLNYNAFSWLTLYKKLCKHLWPSWPRWPLKRWNWEVDDYHFSGQMRRLFETHGFRVLEQSACTPGEPDLDRFLGIDRWLGQHAAWLGMAYYQALLQCNGWGRRFPFSRLYSRLIVAGEKR